MKFLPLLLLSLTLLTPQLSLAKPLETTPYDEIPFLKMFAGKDSKFVREHLGEPDSIVSKENAGGTVEFWVYHELVNQGTTDKVYRFTQIGIVNDLVETLGHTNRDVK